MVVRARVNAHQNHMTFIASLVQTLFVCIIQVMSFWQTGKKVDWNQKLSIHVEWIIGMLKQKFTITE